VLDFETRIVTGLDRDDMCEAIDQIVGPEWPEFMYHDVVSNNNWTELYNCWPGLQFALERTDRNEFVAIGNSLAFPWSESVEDLPKRGWDWALGEAPKFHKQGLKPNMQCAIQIVVSSAYRGTGLSHIMVKTMKQLGARQGLSGMVAPVRPSAKWRWPLVPVDEYITWMRDDGLPYDPWMRVHARAGARIVKPCHEAMYIPGTVSEWREWAKLRLEQSGKHIAVGALCPIEADLENDLVTYTEPNVWMYHPPDPD